MSGGPGRPDWIKVHKFEIIKAAAAGDKTNFIHPLLICFASNEAPTIQSGTLQMQILNWQQDATGGKEARTILPPILRAKSLNYLQINIFQKYKVGRFLIILITDFGLMKSTPYIMNVLYKKVWSLCRTSFLFYSDQHRNQHNRRRRYQKRDLRTQTCLSTFVFLI